MPKFGASIQNGFEREPQGPEVHANRVNFGETFTRSSNTPCTPSKSIQYRAFEYSASPRSHYEWVAQRAQGAFGAPRPGNPGAHGASGGDSGFQSHFEWMAISNGWLLSATMKPFSVGFRISLAHLLRIWPCWSFSASWPCAPESLQNSQLAYSFKPIFSNSYARDAA